MSLSCQLETMNCFAHDKPLEIYCVKCDKLICQDCTERIHKDHDYYSVTFCYRERCQSLKTSQKSVSENISAISNILAELTEKEKTIQEQQSLVKEEIGVMAEEMKKIVDQSKDKLKREVDEISDRKILVLSEQKKLAKKKLNQLKECEKHLAQTLNSNPQKVVTSTKQMIEQVNDLTQQVKFEELTPKEKADIYFRKTSNIADTLHHIGDIEFFSPSVLQQCIITDIDRQDITTNDKTISFPLSIQLSNSSFLNVPPSSLGCSIVQVGEADYAPITATVTTNSRPGVYTIECTPLTNGHHQVNILVNDVQVGDATLVIPFNSHLANITPVCTIPNLNRPYGVAVTNDGSIIVSEKDGNSVTVIDKNYKKVMSLNVRFSHPRGVAITSDSFIIVSDDHKIQKLSMNGECMESIGKKGGGSLKFNDPCGMAISPITGRIYIADQYNHRIQVLNPDLTFSHCFGTKGSGDGQFEYPRDVAIDREGQIVYVADLCNNRIQSFTPEGKFLSQFGSYGSRIGQLTYPSGIVVDNNLLYVTEGCVARSHVFSKSAESTFNHRISIFTTNGQLVRVFGRKGSNVEEFNGPFGITVDREGYLYVCDMFNNRIVVY